jgi:hypothetical protein
LPTRVASLPRTAFLGPEHPVTSVFIRSSRRLLGHGDGAALLDPVVVVAEAVFAGAAVAVALAAAAPQAGPAGPGPRRERVPAADGPRTAPSPPEQARLGPGDAGGGGLPVDSDQEGACYRQEESEGARNATRGECGRCWHFVKNESGNCASSRGI